MNQEEMPGLVEKYAVLPKPVQSWPWESAIMNCKILPFKFQVLRSSK